MKGARGGTKTDSFKSMRSRRGLACRTLVLKNKHRSVSLHSSKKRTSLPLTDSISEGGCFKVLRETPDSDLVRVRPLFLNESELRREMDQLQGGVKSSKCRGKKDSQPKLPIERTRSIVALLETLANDVDNLSTSVVHLSEESYVLARPGKEHLGSFEGVADAMDMFGDR